MMNSGVASLGTAPFARDARYVAIAEL